MKGTEYFFTHVKEGVPKEVAAGVFTLGHLTVLAIVFAAYAILILAFRKRSPETRRKFIIVCSLLITASEIARIIWVIWRLGFSLQDILPLQLCGLMIFFVPAAVITRRKLLQEFIYACGMAGAGFALITPDVNIYPVIHFNYIQSFFIHGLIVFVPLFLIIAEGFRPDYRYLPKVFGLLVSLLPFIYLINLAIGSNFFFLMEAPPGTLIDTYNRIAGYPGYILLMLMTMFAVWVVLYIPWIVHERLINMRSEYRYGKDTINL